MTTASDCPLHAERDLSAPAMAATALRLWLRMPWREQVCWLCGHALHATVCPCDSDDDPGEVCGCNARRFSSVGKERRGDH